MRFYRNIISRASQIARRNKYLWWFGLFTLFLGGKGVEFELFFSDARLLGESISPFSAAFWKLQTWEVMQQNLLGVTGGPWPFFLITLALLFVLVILVVISQGALIDAAAKIDTGGAYSLTQGVEAGKKRFTGLFGVNLIGKVIQYLLITLVGGVIFFISPSRSAAALIYAVFLFLVMTPVAMLISLLMKYAQVEVMVYEARVGEAWQAAWKTFKTHWLVSVEMAALMFLLYFGVGLLAILIAAVATLPVLLFLLAGTIFYQSYALVALYVYIFYFATLVALVVAALYFATMNYSAWTLLYMQLRGTVGRIRTKTERLLTDEFPAAPARRPISTSSSTAVKPAARKISKPVAKGKTVRIGTPKRPTSKQAQA
ncbi:MAG: hypothetical protein AAB558_04470 [Patescibacteria group bacterium]